jgi:hypothetical protein
VVLTMEDAMATPRLRDPTLTRSPAASDGRWTLLAVGVAAVVVPLLYVASDALEVAQGGHTTASLVLTYLGEAPVVFYVLGLYQVQRPRIGLLGLVGAVLFGYAFVFWAGFTLHGLLTHATDLPALAADLGGWYWLHAVLQTTGGTLFAIAAWRARVLPRWSAALLLAAMIGHVLLSVSGLPESYRWVTTTAQNLAFVAMGAAVVRAAMAKDAPAARVV